MLNRKIDDILSYSLISIIPFLLTGPFIPDAILSICSIMFLLLLIKEKKLIILNNFFFIFIFIFIAIISLSSVISGNLKSIISSIGYLRFLLFIYFVSFMLKYSKNDLYLLTYYGIFFSFLYLFFEFLSQSIFSSTILGNDVLNPTRYIISSFYHEEIYSSYVVRILPLCIGLYLFNLKKLNNFFKYSFPVLFLILILIIINNGERSALGLLILSLIFFFIFLDIGIKNKIKIILIFAMILPIFYLSMSDVSINRKLNGILALKFTIKGMLNKENEQKIIISEKYNSLYRTGINIYKEYPIIGSGIKNFRNKCSDKKFAFNERSCATSPHNLIVQLLAETGSLGLFYYLSIIYILINLLIKNLKQKLISSEKKNYFTCLLCCVFISLWPFFPSGNFFNNWISVIMFFPIGFILNEVYLKKQ